MIKSLGGDLRNIILLFISTFLYSATINVPEDYPTIQEGIDAAATGDTVFIAMGTYSPETGENFPIIMISNINLIGEDEETTILDAQQTGTVVTMENCENNTISDLTIKGGAGINGGGMYLRESNPLLNHVTIRNNTSTFYGGGMHLRESNPTLTYVTISHNTAISGGGMSLEESNPILTYVLISYNIIPNDGGGMFLSRSNPTLIHVTISHNTANEGQGMVLNSSAPTVTNSIVWHNIHCHNDWCHESIYLVGDENEPTITYSNIEDGWEGVGNIDSDPLFINPENDNYTLLEDSPCIDIGTADLNGNGIDDITNYSGSAPDMGAFEYNLFLGDVNGDQEISILDIIIIVSIAIENHNPSDQEQTVSDINYDTIIDILDIILLINIILNN